MFLVGRGTAAYGEAPESDRNCPHKIPTSGPGQGRAGGRQPGSGWPHFRGRNRAPGGCMVRADQWNADKAVMVMEGVIGTGSRPRWIA